jgi:hypothetical protein
MVLIASLLEAFIVRLEWGTRTVWVGGGGEADAEEGGGVVA